MLCRHTGIRIWPVSVRQGVACERSATTNLVRASSPQVIVRVTISQRSILPWDIVGRRPEMERPQSPGDEDSDLRFFFARGRAGGYSLCRYSSV